MSILWQLGRNELVDGVRSVPVYALWAGTVATFATLARCFLPATLGRYDVLVVAGGLGYFCVGLLVMVAGHVGMLRPMPLLVAGATFTSALAVPVFRRSWLLPSEGRILRKAPSKLVSRAAAAVVLIVLLVAVIASVRGTGFDDDHRWPSAARWASAGRWVDSGRRLTNGSSLSEQLMVIPAVAHVTTAAHWFTMTTFLLALTGAAAISVRLDTSPIIGAMAACSVPTLVRDSAISSGDVPALALGLGALLIAYDAFATGRVTPAHRVISGLLIAACLSVKLTAAVVGFPVLVLLIVSDQGWRGRINTIVGVCAVPMTCLALWGMHTHIVTGNFIDRNGMYLARDPGDPMWTTGQAAGRVPSVADIVTLPVDLFKTSIFGQLEPFGGRTGILWVAGLAVAVLFGLLKNAKAPVRRVAGVTFLAAVTIWMILGSLSPKTRFNLIAFVLLAVFAGWAFVARAIQSRPVVRRTLLTMLVLGSAVGAADGIRKLLLGVILIKPASAVIVDNGGIHEAPTS